MLSMGNWKPKYATAEQVAMIEQFAAAADGNLEALKAFGADCVHEYDKALTTQTCLIAFGAGILVAATESLIRYLVKRRKEKKTEESDQ
jgi:hypothetical protein